MWCILQKILMEDFVIITCNTKPVWEFVHIALAEAGID